MSLSHELSFVKGELTKWVSPGLDTLIHYVTSRCTAHCDHCYFLDSLNKRSDLDAEETFRFIDNVGRLKVLLVGGGEPFLSKILAEVLIRYVNNCGLEYVQIPTMGFHTDRIERVVNEVMDSCPDLNLTVSISLDGFADFHDANRHVPGLFDRTLETMALLKGLKKRHPRLRLAVNTVLMPENFARVEALADFIRKEIDPDMHYLEPIRAVEFDYENTEFIHSVRELAIFWKGLMRHYLEKEQPGSNHIYFSSMLRKQITNFSMHTLDIKLANFLDRSPWPAPCVAGRKIAVLYPNGDFSVCELRDRILNLRDFDMRISDAMHHEDFKKEVAAVAVDKCFCTHGCFVPMAVRFSPTAMLKVALGSIR